MDEQGEKLQLNLDDSTEDAPSSKLSDVLISLF